MTKNRFELLVTWVLLAFTVWYGLTMIAYPANAGRVPGIVSIAMIAGLLTQLVALYRHPAAAREVSALPAVGTGRVDVDQAMPDEGSSHESAHVSESDESYVEPETSGYDRLIALDGIRRRRFFTIVAFGIAFYFGMIMVGFVVTTGVLMVALLLVARESIATIIIGGVVSTAAVYLLVVVVMGLPALDGHLVS